MRRLLEEFRSAVSSSFSYEDCVNVETSPGVGEKTVLTCRARAMLGFEVKKQSTASLLII